jgi:sortase A
LGKPLARLRIPSIDLEAIVIEGANDAQLNRGPGHISKTALPGELGNCVIAGHRAYWFKRLPEVRRGAPIWVETPLWRYKYIVEEKRVVTPDRGDLLNRAGDFFLTLVTCTTPTADSTHRALVFCRLQELIPR